MVTAINSGGIAGKDSQREKTNGSETDEAVHKCHLSARGSNGGEKHKQRGGPRSKGIVKGGKKQRGGR